MAQRTDGAPGNGAPGWSEEPTDRGLDDLTVGVATSAYQIEGAVREDGRGPSIWDTFSHTPGRVADGHTGDVAADHYHRLEEDLDLLAWLGVDAYRFSIAWPRVQPGGAGPANPAGVDFYSRLVDGLLERGIAPMATLYHWDLPQELQDRGGWTNRDTAQRFAEYATLACGALGDRVAQWATLNEPWCAAYLGHWIGEHAPGLRGSAEATVRSAHHLMLAHGLGVQALRHAGARDVGLVVNPAPVRSASDDPEDRAAARATDGTLNRWWLDAALTGSYPGDILDAFDRVTDLSFIADDDPATAGTPIDWLGVNYYTDHTAVHGAAELPAGPGLDGVTATQTPGERTGMGWAITPHGLTDLLLRIAADYPPIPLWVTENGAAYPDVPDPDGEVRDPARVAYLRSHLAAALAARDAGADVRGYLAWSLMDNFEWAHGYNQRFGIVYVDFDTGRRIPKTSAHWLRGLLAARRGRNAAARR